MPIAKRHDELPTPATLRGTGRKPDPEPTFLRPYFDALRAQREAEGERPHAVGGTWFRHSMAAECARKIAYHALHVPESNPMDLAGMLVTGNGTTKHDEIQAALVAAWGDAIQIEVPCKIEGFNGSGRADGLLTLWGDDAEDTDGAVRHEVAGGSRDGMPRVDGGDRQPRLRSDRGRVPESGGRTRASGVVGDGEREADTGGSGDRSPLSESSLREPGASGSGDGGGEQPEGGRGADRMQEGGAPLHAGEHDPTPEPINSGMPRLRFGEEALGLPGQKVCWELKTLGGFAHKMAVGERGAPQGPKHAHKVQGALNALALNADLLVITYMTWEAISVQAAAKKKISEEGRIAAQWTFERDEWEPLAREEVERVTGILNLVDGGTLPARKIPDPELPARAVITNPLTGQWAVTSIDPENPDVTQIEDVGSFWMCAYCRWQKVCAETPAGRTPISEVAVTLGIEP